MGEFVTMLMFVAAIVVFYVLRWLAIKFHIYLKEKIGTAKESEFVKGNVILSEAFALASVAVEKTAAAIVGKLEQVLGKDLREKVKRGEADKSDLFLLGKEAYSEIIGSVKPELIAELGKSIDNVEGYVENVIESELVKLKSTLYGAKQEA